MNFQVKLVFGDEILPYLDVLAELRISIFREYPYLYDGDKDYETNYLKKFIFAKNACVVLAFEHNKVVGALSGLALHSEDELIFKPWVSSPDFSSIYYVSEILIVKTFRGTGLGYRMFRAFDEWIQDSSYKKVVLATVERPEDHPLKPILYKSLDNFWHNNGYEVAAGKFCCISWKEVEESSESLKVMKFWVKNLI